MWTFTLWGWFLFRISRLKLPLTPTHPDRAGGLGFGLASFAPTVVSLSIIMSAGFAYEIYHQGESLDSLKYHLAAYALLVTFAVHLPVMPFDTKSATLLALSAATPLLPLIGTKLPLREIIPKLAEFLV